MNSDTITLHDLANVASKMEQLAEEVMDISAQAHFGEISPETAAMHLKEIKDRLAELFA